MICLKFLIPYYHIKAKNELSLQLTKCLCSYKLIYISFPKHKTEHLPDLHRFTYMLNHVITTNSHRFFKVITFIDQDHCFKSAACKYGVEHEGIAHAHRMS